MGKSRSFRALWAMEESKLDYEYVVVKFGSNEENGAASVDYRNLNSQGKVPTLVDDDFISMASAPVAPALLANSKALKSGSNLSDVVIRLKSLCIRVSL